MDFFRARAAEQSKFPSANFSAWACCLFRHTRVADARAAIEEAIGRSKLRLAGWRRVPVNPTALGQRAFETMPEIWQFFIEPFPPKTPVAGAAAKFERSLYLLRKRAEGLLPERCYSASLSSRTIVYKGLLTPWQFPRFYEDLRSPEFAATFRHFPPALLHQHRSLPGSSLSRSVTLRTTAKSTPSSAIAAGCALANAKSASASASASGSDCWKKTSAIPPVSITRWK